MNKFRAGAAKTPAIYNMTENKPICPLCNKEVTLSEGDLPAYLGSNPVHLACVALVEDGGAPPALDEDELLGRGYWESQKFEN